MKYSVIFVALLSLGCAFAPRVAAAEVDTVYVMGIPDSDCLNLSASQLQEKYQGRHALVCLEVVKYAYDQQKKGVAKSIRECARGSRKAQVVKILKKR